MKGFLDWINDRTNDLVTFFLATITPIMKGLCFVNECEAKKKKKHKEKRLQPKLQYPSQILKIPHKN